MAPRPIESVATIGAGASGVIAAAACAAEDVFKTIRVFERREAPGGTWIYDPDPGAAMPLYPGKLPPEIDAPLKIPSNLPSVAKPNLQYRYEKTPIYAELTTNVPEIAMSFSDDRFAYGPFVPHWVAKQYIQNYVSRNQIDPLFVFNTTVEDVSQQPSTGTDKRERWKLTLRRYDPVRYVDVWWEEYFDAVIIANGHYSVPTIPSVKSLEEYMQKFPSRISHSKSYRTADSYKDQKVVIIGNSASGHDVTTQLVQSGKPHLPVIQSRRSKGRWDGRGPPQGVEWKPVIEQFDADSGDIIFEDGTRVSDVDAVIYCTGYRPSYPFWNEKFNGGPLYSYSEGRLLNQFQHTFSRNFPRTVGFIGLPRVLTFRSFEYQAVALARLFAGRNAEPLPSSAAQERWELDRAKLVKRERRKYHDIPWDNGETLDWFRYLFEFAGLPVLEGYGRCPPTIGPATRWAIEHVRKYPEPDDREEDSIEGWVVVDEQVSEKDSLYFI